MRAVTMPPRSVRAPGQGVTRPRAWRGSPEQESAAERSAVNGLMQFTETESLCLQLAQNESCFLASARPRRSEAEQLLRTVRVPRLLRPCPVPSSRGGRVTRWLLHSRLPPAAGGAGQVWQSRVTARKRQGQESPASPRLSLGCGHPDRKEQRDTARGLGSPSRVGEPGAPGQAGRSAPGLRPHSAEDLTRVGLFSQPRFS